MRLSIRKITGIFVILSISIIFISCSGKVNPEAQKIADIYGFKQFDQVDAVMFTYNVFEDSTTIRHWIWNVKEGEIHYQGSDPQGNPIEYSYVTDKSDKDTTELYQQINAWFTNDQYWLFFPFHLIWDKSARITVQGPADLPIPQGAANELIMQYPVKGSDVPCNSIDLYYDSSYQILQWTFQRTASVSSALTTTWERNQAVGPIVLSTEHYNADSTFHVWFTDIAIKIEDTEGWIQPE
jgi:hypothetical protein